MGKDKKKQYLQPIRVLCRLPLQAPRSPGIKMWNKTLLMCAAVEDPCKYKPCRAHPDLWWRGRSLGERYRPVHNKKHGCDLFTIMTRMNHKMCGTLSKPNIKHARSYKYVVHMDQEPPLRPQPSIWRTSKFMAHALNLSATCSICSWPGVGLMLGHRRRKFLSLHNGLQYQCLLCVMRL